jgi:hypothetical protein
VVAAAAFAAATVVPNPALASVSDEMIVYDPGGAIYARLPASENQEGGLYHFDPSVILPDSVRYYDYTLVYEPDGTTVSDVFGVMDIGSMFNSILVLGFTSDPLPIPSVPWAYFGYYNPFASVVVEGPDGCLADATKYLPPDLRAAGWTATFSSDGDAVPEPATLIVWSVLGATGAGLGVWRKRKRAVAVRL